MPHTAGAWRDVTRVPYNSDDPRYRDYDSNSSGGAGQVTGRITGLAADNAATCTPAAPTAACGGRPPAAATGRRSRDQLPRRAAATCAGRQGSLWYATGEANTGGDAYVGSGVYVLANPRHRDVLAGRPGRRQRAGVHHDRHGCASADTVWAATNRGVWYHDASTTAGAWKLEFARTRTTCPDRGRRRQRAGPGRLPDRGATDAAYKNIVNDMAIDPKNPKHVIAAIGWRSGDTYNGFYETTEYTAAPSSWKRLDVCSATCTNSTDVGDVTFAFSRRRRLYAMIQQPSKINGSTNLDGVYVSKSGSPFGPWNKIADSPKLHNSGSALDRQGYARRPGLVQPVPRGRPGQRRPRLRWAWRRSSRPRTPARTGRPSARTGTSASPAGTSTPPSRPAACIRPHPDQHAVAVGTLDGKQYVVRRQRRRRLQAAGERHR